MVEDTGDAVGRVLGTEDATPLTFSVAVGSGNFLQLDDVVTTVRTVPGGPDVRISGVVTDVRARHEGASFDSDVFLIEDGVLPAMTVESAEVTTTRVDRRRITTHGTSPRPPLPRNGRVAGPCLCRHTICV